MAFRFDQLTLKSQEAVQAAQGLARDRGHQRLEPMHLLAALLDPEQVVIRSLLTQLGVNPAQLLKAAEEGLNSLPRVSGAETTLGSDLNRVLEQAQDEATRMKDQYVSVEHLLLGLTKVKSKAQDLLTALGSTRRTCSRPFRKCAGGNA
jgi:ATP-dependent Clp protease ATP-binding subunit ClpB